MQALALLFVTTGVTANRPSPTMCQRIDGGPTSACGPGNDFCHAPGYGTTGAPQFHVRDASCAMNDPAAVSYDPLHAIYHDHWEDHLAAPGGQYVRGHAVSRDLIHWAHLPVSLWNDRPYDNYAIFTGSATLVDGTVVQVYPGLCKRLHQWDPACPGATNLAIAVPEDPSDPFQTNWTKDGKVGGLTGYVNPIANNTGRDPSTAWQTPAGEWRFTSYGSEIFGSLDFKAWYHIGQQKTFPGGECPSFFPLPATTPGAGAAPADAGTPTHVYKASHSGKDWMSVGSYTAGAPKTLGTWTVMGKEVLIDTGQFYASKDFYDPVGKRRINWGWAQIAYGPWNDGSPWDSSAHTLPREVTWNPELQQLVFSPLVEQSQLRGSIVGQLKAQALPANKSLSLGLPRGAGNQTELVVSFERPTVAVKLTVEVMVGGAGTGVAFTIDYTPPAADATGASVVPVSCPSIRATDSLRLSPKDRTIDVRVFVDNVMAEVYFQNGRVAMTVPSFCHSDTCGMAVGASAGGASLASATAWAVKSIWVSPEEVLQTPRADGGAENADAMAGRIHAQQRST